MLEANHSCNFTVNVTQYNESCSVIQGTDESGSELRLAELISIIFLILLGISGNLLLITTITRCRHLHTVSNALLLNLGVIDLFLAVLVVPPWALVTSRGQQLLPHSLCQAVAVTTMLLFLESLCAIACIALDRYLRICHPMNYQELVTKQRAAVIIILTWIVTILLSLSPLINFGHYTFQPSSLFICSAQFHHHTAYSALLLGTTVFPACILTIVCYWKIFRAARHQARRIADISITVQHPQTAPVPPLIIKCCGVPPKVSPDDKKDKNDDDDNDDDDVSQSSSIFERAWKGLKRTASQTGLHGLYLWRAASNSIKRSLQQNRALKTVLTIIGGFMACWFPYIVHVVYLTVRSEQIQYKVEFLVTFLAFSNTFVNPAICALVNKDYRKAMLLSLGIGRHQREKDIMQRVVVALTPSNIPSIKRLVQVKEHWKERSRLTVSQAESAGNQGLVE